MTVEVFSGSGTSGIPFGTLTATRTGGSGAVEVTASLPEGTYTARARQAQTAGPEGASAPRTFTVDTTAPGVTVTVPNDGATTLDPTPTFVGAAGSAPGDGLTVTVEVFAGASASGTPLRSVDVSRSGSGWMLELAVADALEPGTYTVRARQVDDVGNSGVSNTRTFTLLRAAPEVTLTSPATGRGNDSTPEFAGTAEDRAGDAGSVSVELFSGSDTSGTPFRTLTATRTAAAWSVELPAAQSLTDGTYTARARQTQTQGPDGTSAPRTFTVDTSAPGVTVTVPNDGATTLDPTPTFVGAAGSAPGDGLTVTVEVFAGGSASGAPLRSVDVSRSGSGWTL